MTENRSRAEQAFSRLFGEDASDEHRLRIMAVQKELGLPRNDALWSVLVALDYHLELYRRIPERIAETLEAGTEHAKQRVQVLTDEAQSKAAGNLVETVRAILPQVSGEVTKRERLKWRTRSLMVASILFAVFTGAAVGIERWGFERGVKEGAGVDRHIIEWATSESGINSRALDGRGLLRSLTAEELHWMTSTEGQRGYALARNGTLGRLEEIGIEWLLTDKVKWAHESDKAGLLDGSTLEKLKWLDREGGRLYEAYQAGVFLDLGAEDLVWLLSEKGALAREMDEAGMLNYDSMSKMRWLEGPDGKWAYNIALQVNERDWRRFQEVVEDCTRKRRGFPKFGR